jgi:pyruvate dehydrogenase (quinone)
MKVGDFVVKRLHAWGVRRIYGYPGDGINGVIGALQRANKIDFIQVRHEEMAAFMAVAHAKFTGEIGVCLSTGGPGASHLITGLYNAKLDHAPGNSSECFGFVKDWGTCRSAWSLSPAPASCPPR